ncbi:unnamed protein product [Schistosoma margrebowiei]|uniref:Uncharacterized protein n=1 Tax=Schistosoma margrebowiei TaxID=48269 RepID=A0A183MPB7_9TREM|nr:unnamed protein product [Schistosoma margrebowiei]
MLVGGSQQETLDPGFMLLDTHQQGVSVISSGLVPPNGFYPVSPSFTPRFSDLVAKLRSEKLNKAYQKSVDSNYMNNNNNNNNNNNRL